MAFKKIEIYNEVDLDKRKETLSKNCSKEDYKNICEFLDKLQNGEVTGKPCSEKRSAKLINMFCIFLNNVDKPLSEITKDDLAEFKKNSKKMVKENKETYSDETLEDCTETIARYLLWKYPQKDFTSNQMPLKKWFVIKAQYKTPEILKEDEVKKLYDACKNEAEHYLIAVLFDSGLRPTEFYNIRFQDIIEPTSDSPYYTLQLMDEYSKTEGRNVVLYWKHSTEAMRNYLNSVDRSDARKQVFSQSYDNVRGFLGRLGLRVLKKSLDHYVFRKSSATYYASKMNHQQLCTRYGWKFSSDMPDTYIKRSGVATDNMTKQMMDLDLGKLQKENEQLKQSFNIEMEKMKLEQSAEIQKAIKEAIQKFTDKVLSKKIN